MNNDRLVRFITKQLDAGLAKIDHNNIRRLKLARETAVKRQIQYQEAKLAGIGGRFHVDLFGKRAFLRAAIFFVVALGAAHWHAKHYIVELEEVDSAILIDDMPMDVLTDRGFDRWLNFSAD